VIYYATRRRRDGVDGVKKDTSNEVSGWNARRSIGVAEGHGVTGSWSVESPSPVPASETFKGTRAEEQEKEKRAIFQDVPFGDEAAQRERGRA